MAEGAPRKLHGSPHCSVCMVHIVTARLHRVQRYIMTLSKAHVNVKDFIGLKNKRFRVCWSQRRGCRTDGCEMTDGTVEILAWLETGIILVSWQGTAVSDREWKAARQFISGQASFFECSAWESWLNLVITKNWCVFYVYACVFVGTGVLATVCGNRSVPNSDMAARTQLSSMLEEACQLC